MTAGGNWTWFQDHFLKILVSSWTWKPFYCVLSQSQTGGTGNVWSRPVIFLCLITLGSRHGLEHQTSVCSLHALVSVGTILTTMQATARQRCCFAGMQVWQQVSGCNGTSVQLQAVGCLLVKQPKQLSLRLLLAGYLTTICRWRSEDARRDACLQNRKLLRDWRLSHSYTGFASGKRQHLSEEEDKKPSHLVLSVTRRMR